MKKYTKNNSVDNFAFGLLSAISFLLPLLYYNGFEDPFIDIKNYFLQLMIPAILVYILIFKYGFSGSYQLFKKNPIVKPLLGLLVLAVIFISNAKNQYYSFLFVLTQISYVGVYLIIFAIGKDFFNNKRIILLLKIIANSSLLVVLFGFIFKYKLHAYINLSFTKHILENISTMGNPHFYNQYLIIVIPLTLLLILLLKDSISRGYYMLVFICQTYIFIDNRSFGSWISLFLSVILLSSILIYNHRDKISKAFLYKKIEKFNSIILILFLVIVLLINPIHNLGNIFGYSIDYDKLLYTPVESFEKEIKDTFKIKLETSSTYYRIKLWESSLKMIKDSPILGKGLNSFQFEFNNYQNYKAISGSETSFFTLTKRAHNDYLQSWIELSIIGFILLIIVVYNAIKSVVIAISNCKVKEELLIYSFFGISIIAVVVFATNSFPFQMPVSAFYFWLSLGIIHTKLSDNNEIPVLNISFNNKYLKLLTILILVSPFWIFTVRDLIASTNYRNGLNEMKSNKIGESLAYFNRSLKYNNSNYYAHHYKGILLAEKENYDEAISSFENSARLSNFHLSNYELAKIYFYKNDYLNALERVETCLKSYPYFEEALILAGNLHLLTSNNVIKSKIYFSEATRINDKNISGLYGLAEIKFRLQQFEEAKLDLLKVIELKKTFSNAYKLLGEIYYVQNDYSNSYTYFNSYLSQISVKEEGVLEKIKLLETKLK